MGPLDGKDVISKPPERESFIIVVKANGKQPEDTSGLGLGILMAFFSAGIGLALSSLFEAFRFDPWTSAGAALSLSAACLIIWTAHLRKRRNTNRGIRVTIDIRTYPASTSHAVVQLVRPATLGDLSIIPGRAPDEIREDLVSARKGQNGSLPQ
jgi:hypothetical protein